MIEPSFQLGGARGQDRRRIGSQDASRVSEHRTPVRLVGDTVCRHENRDVRGAQPVRERRLEHLVLILRCQRRQRVRRRGPQTSGGQFRAGAVGEPGRELQALRHPARLLREQVGDGARREVVLVDQRLDDARLVGGGDRTRWRVGHQHEPLVVDGGQRTLHDHGDGRSPRRAPPLEPLKAVEDLEVSAVDRDDSQRRIGQLLARRGRARGAESSEARSNPIAGERADGLLVADSIGLSRAITRHRHGDRSATARACRSGVRRNQARSRWSRADTP